MAKITRNKSKLSDRKKSLELNGDFRPLGFVLVAILVSAVLFLFVGSFRDWVISIVAKVVDTLILSNLFVFNLAVIAVLIVVIIIAIFIYRKL